MLMRVSPLWACKKMLTIIKNNKITNILIVYRYTLKFPEIIGKTTEVYECFLIAVYDSLS